jgi:hypothetical protein
MQPIGGRRRWARVRELESGACKPEAADRRRQGWYRLLVAGIRRLVGDSVLLVEDGASRSTERAKKEGDENG